jgi:hypothetical protein
MYRSRGERDRYLLDTGGGQECYKCGKVPASVADTASSPASATMAYSPSTLRTLGTGLAESEIATSSISAVASAARPAATRVASKVAAAAAVATVVPDQGHGCGRGGGYTGLRVGLQLQEFWLPIRRTLGSN